MTPLVQAALVNDPFGDAGLYIDFRFRRRAILFDLGDLHNLPPRNLSRVSHVFVSHTHMDHFCGFDRLLEICLARRLRLDLYGPPGFIDRVDHKLNAYTWNLVTQNTRDFVLAVSELHGDTLRTTAEFHSQDSFHRRPALPPVVGPGVLLDESDFLVRAVTLDHGIPCLGFALEEKLHINVWKTGLRSLGLPVGPWLTAVKAAVRSGAGGNTQFVVAWTAQGKQQEAVVTLEQLKAAALRIVPGQRIAYVADALYSESNARKILALANLADVFFVEATFLDEDCGLASQKFHLTAAQAGRLARQAGTLRVEPFHFSPRYKGREAVIRRQVAEAFAGLHPPGSPRNQETNSVEARRRPAQSR